MGVQKPNKLWNGGEWGERYHVSLLPLLNGDGGYLLSYFILVMEFKKYIDRGR